jgi:hypothetical protein
MKLDSLAKFLVNKELVCATFQYSSVPFYSNFGCLTNLLTATFNFSELSNHFDSKLSFTRTYESLLFSRDYFIFSYAFVCSLADFIATNPTLCSLADFITFNSNFHFIGSLSNVDFYVMPLRLLSSIYDLIGPLVFEVSVIPGALLQIEPISNYNSTAHLVTNTSIMVCKFNYFASNLSNTTPSTSQLSHLIHYLPDY